MAKLVYSAITSIDGYTADRDGKFDWAVPDPEVYAFINDLERGFGTNLYGRRMYETLSTWETFDGADDELPEVREFAELWRAASKVVFSTTLNSVSGARTTLERTFDPAAIRRLKATAGHDISIGGGVLASQAIAAGLVDEIHLFVSPITVGGGVRALIDPPPSTLELVTVDRFAAGVVHLHYRM